MRKSCFIVLASVAVFLQLATPTKAQAPCYSIFDEDCSICRNDAFPNTWGVSCGNLCGWCDPMAKVCECPVHFVVRNATRPMWQVDPNGKTDYALVLMPDGVHVDEVVCGFLKKCNENCYPVKNSYGVLLGYGCTTPNDPPTLQEFRCSKWKVIGQDCVGG